MLHTAQNSRVLLTFIALVMHMCRCARLEHSLIAGLSAAGAATEGMVAEKTGTAPQSGSLMPSRSTAAAGAEGRQVEASEEAQEGVAAQSQSADDTIAGFWWIPADSVEMSGRGLLGHLGACS